MGKFLLFLSLFLIVIGFQHCSDFNASDYDSVQMDISKSSTNHNFTSHGINYAPQGPSILGNQKGQPWHKAFSPTQYNRDKIFKDLDVMQRQGFNSVRVFMDHEESFNEDATPNPEYFDNLAEFIELAKKRNIKVAIAVHWISPYVINKHNSVESPFLERYELDLNPNLLFISRKGRASQAYTWRNIISSLQQRGAIDNVWAVDIWNEGEFDPGEAPFNLRSPITYEGHQFDLNNNVDRERFADHAVTLWANDVTEAIKKQTPNIVVYASVFSAHAVGLAKHHGFNKGHRAPFTTRALSHSQLDQIGLHIYPWDNDMRDFNINQELELLDVNNIKNKPFIIDEIGILNSQDPELGFSKLLSATTQLCRPNIKGLLFWAYQRIPSGDGRYWYNSDELLRDRPISLCHDQEQRTNSTNEISDIEETEELSTNEDGGPDTTMDTSTENQVSTETPLEVSQKISEGLFRINTALYYSNGHQYCFYNNWETFKCATGLNEFDVPQIRNIPHIPDAMIDDGICQVSCSN